MISKAHFGVTSDQASVDIYTLRNQAGMEAKITTYGGIVVSLKTPDKNGRFEDVVLGYDHLDGYLKNNPCFGTLIGRYGNRIAKGKFCLDGTTYTLAINNGHNHLHGGIKGFDKVVWSARPVESSKGPALELTYLSQDGEEGYPGNLSVTAVYSITQDNALTVDFTATTDKKTVCNLTHHSYFNLAGAGDVLDHIVQIHADHFTPVDSGLIPTGELRPVAGGPLDFRQPMTIGKCVNDLHDEQLKFGNGYDHNFVLNKRNGDYSLAARVSEPKSGRVMEVWTSEPGVQFYTGNFLDGTIVGKKGQAYLARSGFCFEPQHFPDSPNRPEFPSTVLNPGEIYHCSMAYKFPATQCS